MVGQLLLACKMGAIGATWRPFLIGVLSECSQKVLTHEEEADILQEFCSLRPELFDVLVIYSAIDNNCLCLGSFA